MILVKVLKRKDASSVVVAVAVGLVIFTFVSSITERLASRLSSRNPQPVVDWHSQYLYPLVLAVLELLVLEILGWLYVWAVVGMKKK
ncbi:hypothetical protein KW801_03595 [Candidatus Saccharibacteria bacterium]|nr:hypothetical protein [Candidatus Saccharibacteria bacterium]